jgi:peptide chain release factor 3
MLALDVTPMTWPVGMGGEFEGIYDLATNRLLLPEGDSREFHGKVSRPPGSTIRSSTRSFRPKASPSCARKSSWRRVGYPEFDAKPIATAI